MNQLISAAGLELLEVQLTSTLSPSEYLSLPPVINGPFFGRTMWEQKIQALYALFVILSVFRDFYCCSTKLSNSG